jgi:hypothetical protein
MHLLVAAKAHHRLGTSHSRHIGEVSKGKLHVNGIINRQYGAGRSEVGI